MIRVFILIGFTYLFIHLHASGDISKYINMKYAYISEFAIYILLIFTLISIYFYQKGETSHSHCHDEHCDHDHSHEINRWWKRWATYLIFLFPIVSGLFFPIATLDSNIVEKKGFNFPVFDDNDPYSRHQFLQPDTSVYYGEEGYEDLMDSSLKKLLKKPEITLNEDNYLSDLETVYNYSGDFIGRDMSITGFSYKTSELANNQLFLFRFGIIHCIADSGVYGMLVEFPDDLKVKNDEWLKVSGKLETIYYQPFKKTIPIIKVTSWQTISQPKDPYVYRTY
ncbi:TIGR03943 family putative permease subunit [Bacillus sp. 03113]|uniref:TIGR03943 family putative permease subunit n=1 Tax=Bacillus sp. 03113 TaxID=2578211 RepID=UPI0011415197|nr:TIGR03943 family protein [Bacillus sp. 03113]